MNRQVAQSQFVQIRSANSITEATLLRWQWKLGVASWILIFAVTVLYFVIWRTSVLRMSPWLWLATTLAVLATEAGLTCVTARALWNRISPARVWGRWMVWMTPLVCFGTFFAHQMIRVHARQNLELTTPLRVCAVWACGAAELEARWRYPHRITGEAVELFSPVETANGTQWVEQLDAHAQRMAAELGQPLPPARIAWVRGDLLGFTGRSIYMISICDHSIQNPNYLDFHEVAHAVISGMAGPDQDPPMFLAEGWAQCHSTADRLEDRRNAIRGLWTMRQRGDRTRLKTWMEVDNYGRSFGPAYSHGAPFTIYLLERFGGPRFFELYRDIRRQTALADVERILGIPWDALEDDFWKWFDAEVQALQADASERTPYLVSFAPGVDPALWQTLMDGCEKNFQSDSDLPQQLALRANYLENGVVTGFTDFVREHGTTWAMSESVKYPGHTEWKIDSPEVTRFIERDAGYRTIRGGRDSSTEYQVQMEISQSLSRALQGAQLASEISTWNDRPSRIRQLKVMYLSPPQPDRQTWQAEFEMELPWQVQEHLFQWAADDFRVLRHTLKDSGNITETTFTFEKMFGRVVTSRKRVVSGSTTFECELHKLDDTAVLRVKDEVNAAISQGPNFDLRSALIARCCPLIALLWPLASMTLLWWANRKRPSGSR